ncbi:macrolide family glycosyltransferase [Streptomyces sp. NBC_01565]|uniref:macrolide family glycosyltransferase n=1 Tax=Streptomyces sp. NBC_01565 TaxID=2975881 RepID=UPI002255E87D|nr:macrolide family glycosyltransferase [Streptomyces sp. NBC_01565]MCX4546674.1 OleI family self-immunity macrolide glycosyltransferase [Streptomyces sp. NBC_01565]
MRDVLADGEGRGRHVAVFNVPMHGHVIPTLAVVQELVDRGHRVSYAVTAEFADDVRAVGATPVLYGAPAVGEAPEDMAEGVTGAVVVNVAALSQLEEAFGQDVPDVVLSDVYAWAGPLLAARWGVPAVQLAPTHIPYDGLVQEFFGLEDIAQIPGFPELAGALEEFGVPGGVHALTLAPPRTIAFFPRSFQRLPETVKAGEAHWVGPAIADRSFQGHWQRPEGGKPVLYVSLGSQFNRRPEFYRSCLQAFEGLGWHVVMSVGAEVAAAGLGSVGDGFEVHASVPQLDVLASASVFVTHGGMGSLMEALSLGVPVVVVPQMAEQRVNAGQVEQLGVGRHLPREQVTAQALREAVQAVADDQRIAGAVAGLRQEISQAGGAAAAADVVEKVLADTPMVTG